MDAIVSLLSGGRGFLLGVVGQIHLIKKYCSDKPTVLLIEGYKYSHQQKEYLERIGWQLKDVPPLRSKWTKFAASRWPNTFTKLQLWGLTEYQHVLYMDSDAYPYNDLSVFDQYRPNTLAATHHPKAINRFRSGLMIVRPDKEVLHNLVNFLSENPSINGAKLGDQGVLNCYFKDNWERLPFNLHTVDWYRRINKVTIGHIRPKPWVHSTKLPSRMRPYTNLWKESFDQITKEYGCVP